MTKEIKRKLIAFISSSVVLFNSFAFLKGSKDSDEIIYNSEYRYLSSSVPFAYYNDKCVYIGYRFNETDENNIYIIDGRYLHDPDVRVIDSYKICNLKDIKNIVKILMEYENEFPSKWERTSKAMELEWLIHNCCYYLDIETNRSGDVDFNNEDENKYLILKK